MKGKHVVGLVLGGIALIWFIWAIFAWGSSPKYDPTISAETVKNLLADRGLEACDEKILSLQDTPGLVSARSVSVSTQCGVDKNPVQLTLLEFDSEESRNAAQTRVATAHRTGYGPHFSYSYGPYVITMQGTRGIGDQLLVGKTLSEAAENQ